MNVRAVLVYASGIGAGALISLITLPALAWMFSAEDVGRVALFQLSLSLIVVFFSLGLDQSYVRNFNEVSDTAVLAKNCMLPGFFLLLVVIAISSLFSGRIMLYLFDIDSYALFFIFLFSAIILYMERFFSVFIRMKELSFAYSMTRVVPKLLFLVLVMVFLVFPDGKSFTLLAGMQCISWLAVVLIMIFFLKRKFAFSASNAQGRKSTEELLYFGFPLMLSGIAFWGLNYIDRIMLKELSSLSQLGIYAMASTLAGAAILFQQIFTTMWHPLIYRWASEGVAETKITGLSAAIQLFSLVFICLAALCSFMVSYILPKEYVLVQYMLPACLIPPLYLMMTEVSGVGISISKKTKFLPVITAICMATNIILNNYLIPYFGAGGAAAAAAMSFFTYFILKTEMSNYVWVPFSNSKFYIFSIVVVFLSVVSSLWGGEFKAQLCATWLVIMVFCILGYSSQVKKLFIFVRGYL